MKTLETRIPIAVLMAIVCSTLGDSPARGEANPLRFISNQLIRPEVLIVLDTSLSMSQVPGGGGTSAPAVGSECSGHDPDIDRTGDYMCSGWERYNNTTAGSDANCQARGTYLHWLSVGGTNRCATNEGSNYAGGTFTSDCAIYDDFDSRPGSSQKCRFRSDSPATSRMYIAKRALRTVLREFRGSGSFGLISLAETGYYRYRKANTATPSVVGFYLSERELKAAQAVCTGTTTICTRDSDCTSPSTCGPSSWVRGLGWDTTNDKPADTFQPGGTGPVYRLLNTLSSGAGANPSTAGNSLYRSIADVEDAKYRDPAGTNPCSSTSPCGHGEGDCNGDNNNCAFGTICVQDSGSAVWGNLAVPTGVNASEVDVCLDPFGGANPSPVWYGATSSCYTGCSGWCHMGPTCGSNSGGCSTWGNRSCATGHKCYSNVASRLWSPATLTATGHSNLNLCLPDQAAILANATVTGAGTHSKVKFIYQRFDWSGRGKQFEESGKTWEYIGSYYTYEAHGVVAMNTLNTDYKYTDRYYGPEYRDGTTTWVYNRFGSTGGPADSWFGQGYETYGINSSNANPYGGGNGALGRIVVPLFDAQANASQQDFDRTLGAVYSALNSAEAGGLTGLRFWTPTDYALLTARDHYTERFTGTAPYFSAADPAKNCRKKFILMLSDGECTGTGCATRLNDNAAALYNNSSTHGQIQTLAIALPGMDADGINQMRAVADCGSDGVCGNCGTTDPNPLLCSGFVANSEAELVEAIRSALFAALAAEYATAPSSASTTSASTLALNASLTPFVEFPGWKGHLRAIDHETTTVPTELWDAGALLNLKAWAARNIYTITAEETNSGEVVRLWDGTTEPTATIDSTRLAKIRAAWLPAGTAPSDDDDLRGFIKWLAGKDRTWKLPPIINAVPVSVGPPPDYPGATHDSFETANASRQRLIYVGSNEGLLHAFDAETGQEEWAFVSGYHLDRAYKLYKQAGQDDDPRNFSYLLASSPRVEDIFDGTNWRTILIQGDGPGGEDFYALDVTDTNPTTLKMLFSSARNATAVGGKFGETWSLPAIYWVNASGSANMSMGSGYENTAGEGQWYNQFTDISASWPTNLVTGPTIVSDQQAPGSSEVKFAVFPDTVATIDATTNVVVDTYQADLDGRVYRRPGGTPASVTPMIDVGVTNPIHFSPAVWKDAAAGKDWLAFASGSFYDDQIIRDSAGTSLQFETSSTTFAPHLYVYKYATATSALDPGPFSCQVDQICGTCLDPAPAVCINPSIRAMPVTSPLMLLDSTSGRLDIYYLLYDMPAAQCSGSSVAIGDSYLVKLRYNTATGLLSVSESSVNKMANTQASGLTVIGTNTVVITTSGPGKTAKPQNADGTEPTMSPATGVGGVGGAAIETWREVR